MSVSGLFALLVYILIGGVLMIYCQRVQNETNIEAENQTSVTNILLQNSKGTVYKDSKVLADVACFAKLVEIGLLIIWEEHHALNVH